ncbi:MAG: LysM peptidoglycan-binding domain-containing protein [Chloroflexi bacterium]|nr:LysM peptidoglycan-binding domain-containing protein [Chloroflexota bacterium]
MELILRLFDGLEPDELPDCPVGVTLIHQVEPGETLFRIAQRYRTTVAVLAAANNLADPTRITSGQLLTIPCGVDTGLPSIPPPAAPENITPVDCSRFAATSPLDGLPYGTGTFYWNPAPGATAYRLNIFNEDDRPGAQVASVTVDRNTTSVTLDLSINSIGYGFRFSWEVLALLPDGTPACASGRAIVPRAAPPTDAPPQPPASEPTPEPTPEETPFPEGR